MLFRSRGWSLGELHIPEIAKSSKRDSALWMLRNGTPWFFKRSFDLLPAALALMAIEAARIVLAAIQFKGTK